MGNLIKAKPTVLHKFSMRFDLARIKVHVKQGLVGV